jgi:hypothetical protein
MDLCSLEEAFPNIHEGSITKKSEYPFVGGKDGYSSKEERRAARKRAKKCKGPALTYSDSVAGDLPKTDPDRPAVEHMPPVETVQEEKEGFGITALPKASCLFSDPGTPSYFGKGAEDDDETKEGFSSFSASPADDANYRLYPDFTKSEQLKGAAKAAGATLPEPPLTDSWKPMTPAGNYTAFFQEIPRKVEEAKRIEPDPDWSMKAKGSATKGPIAYNEVAPENYNDALLKRIDVLMGRLEELEKKNVKDSQTEILMFVGTGLFILVSFELFSKH